MAGFNDAILSFTLNKLFEMAEITFERDYATRDEFGTEKKKEWKVLATYKGAFSWWQTRGRGMFRMEPQPERDVFTTGGIVILPLGTNVIEQDRVGKVTYSDGKIESGPFRVVSVRNLPTHMEVNLEKP